MSEHKQETPPQRIWLSRSSLSQALKEGVGSYYPNFIGDPLPFALVEYVPATELDRVRRETWQAAFAIAWGVHTHEGDTVSDYRMRALSELQQARDESEKNLPAKEEGVDETASTPHHVCVVCKVEPVCPEEGFDTCTYCVRRI